MQLIITQPVFVWIFGVVGVLLAIILILVVIMLAYGVVLLRLVNEKSKEVAETVETVSHSVRATTESFDGMHTHVEQFVHSAVSAGNIANIVRSVRTAWHGKAEPESKPNDDIDDIFKDVKISNKQSNSQGGATSSPFPMPSKTNKQKA